MLKRIFLTFSVFIFGRFWHLCINVIGIWRTPSRSWNVYLCDETVFANFDQKSSVFGTIITTMAENGAY